MAAAISASLPALTGGLFGEGTGADLIADLTSLQIASLTGEISTSAINIVLPAFDYLFHGVNAASANINLILGWPSIGSISADLRGAGHLSITLPSLSSSINYLTGLAIQINGELNLVEALLAASGENIGRLGAEILYTDLFGQPKTDLPIPTALFTGLTGSLGQISGALPLEQFYSHSLTGSVGDFALELPFLFYDANLLSEGKITLDITLPAILIDSYGTPNEVAISYRVILMNTINKGVSEYEALSFNDMVTFNGDQIAIRNNNSLVKVASALDDTEEIVSQLKTGTLDFSDPVYVKPRDIWVTLRSGQKVKLTMKADEQAENTQEYYSDEFNNALRKTRIKVGRGWYDAFYDFEFENVDGEHVDISSIHILSEPVRGKKR